MPKKKKSDNWKHDCPKIKIKKGDITGTIVAQKKKEGKKRGNVAAQWREKKEKKNAT